MSTADITLDQELRSLIKVIKNINGPTIGDKPDLVKTAFNRWERAFIKTDIELIKEDANHFYKKYRSFIVDAKTSDSWLEEASVIWKYEEGGEKPSPKIALHLSCLYREAKRQALDKERQLINADSEAYEKAVELNYPDIVLLHLYRALVVLEASKLDQALLQGWILEKEKALGLKETEVPDSTPNPMAGMMSMFQNMMGGNKGGFAMPKADQINGMMKSMLGENNKMVDVVTKFSGKLENLKGGDNWMASLAETAKELMADQELMSTVKGIMGTTGDMPALE